MKTDLTLCVSDATGRQYRMRYDGHQYLPPYGYQEQYTAMEEMPGIPDGGTTYAISLEKRGYTIHHYERAAAA